MVRPNIFDDSKYYRQNEPRLSYDERAKQFAEGLILTDDEVNKSADAFMVKYNKLVDDFEHKTKLNKLDLSIMVFAAGIQVLRWAMISNSSLLGDMAERPDAVASPPVPQDDALALEQRCVKSDFALPVAHQG